MADLGAGTLPWLDRALKDDLAIVRARACRNVGALGLDARHLLPVLIELIDDREEIVMREASSAILEVAPEDDQAIDRARRVLERLSK